MSTPDGDHLDFDAVHRRSVVLAGDLPPPVRVPCVADLIALKQLRREPKPADLEDLTFLRVLAHSLTSGDETDSSS